MNGFDVPVPAIDEPFALALIGTKGVWYDHEVVVSDVQISEGDEDKVAADHVAELIDSIYVQKWTEETDAQCEEAKEAWDALTDAQKELVEGEFADSDYFGRDTGDASADDPLNGDDIGEKELLVVSFGTSFNDSRAKDIGGIEKALSAAYPDWSIRRAFTAQIIINHIYARDGEKIDNVDQALQRAVDNGVKNLVVQPTHLMHGAEYDELVETLESYKDKFETVEISEPLLGQVGANETEINDDKKAVAEAITNEAVTEAGFDGLDAAKEDGTAFVFLGHGTSHSAKVTYDQMQTQVEELGYENVFIGTVEGEPEDTEISAVIAKVKEGGYSKVILRPLMVVAGDHANNDMAGDDEDSWKSMFEAASFENIDCQIAGLGEIEAVQDLYVAHTAAVTDTIEISASESTASSSSSVSESDDSALEAGDYEVEFNTDSSMFHVNEAMDGKGTLHVDENGNMYVSIALVSQKILNLYPGMAEDAANDTENLIDPYLVEVTYSDGTTEEVNGFDVPVETIGEDFDLAIIGEKGVWYDHKVSVSNPTKVEE
ncbi:MAG: sirohydrochlorin cobaltochelatase [Butyrivibrio sp.]|nr:sirohydrochlorin cobaltochelatase [Butyrivibrio sp.]